eukprot:TRINITY_DN1639_c0_g1_i1.p1 TRINITY_DN1639_c0_g1~~TRINITY_DN1639_c0_g1_i1.p1  ORF type:complete len:592 (-),score=100.03 TRINITY_DN1639_c0_g1_i1:25-1800(-)
MTDKKADTKDGKKEVDLYSIAILIDELKTEETNQRLNSIRRLGTIAKALGPERTRNELIPFLSETVDDEDEVLHALAEELGNFVDHVGGKEHVHLLLVPLETLSNGEETGVREKAVEALCKCAEAMLPKNFETSFFPLVKRLSTGDWFSSKTSACGLFHVAYPKAEEATKKELRSLYHALCHDQTPMVRRSAAANLKKLVKVVEKEYLMSDIMPLFNHLSKDDQDSVRLLAVENCIAIAEVLVNGGEALSGVMNTILDCSSDKCWRVRYMVAENFCKLCEVVGPEVTKSVLIPSFVKLLKDTEAEVRTAAASKITGVCKHIGYELTTKHFLSCVKELVTDSSQHVRAALASDVMGLAPIFGKEKTIECLLELFLQLLKDDFPEVRLSVISKLEAVNKVIGHQLLSQHLLPAIVELSEDRQWRVRLAIIEFIPQLAKQLGVEFFDEKLLNLCLNWLGDCVFSIREAAINNLKRLTEVFGLEWAQQSIIPKVLALHEHSNYLYRMTTLYSISALSSVVGSKVVNDTMLPLVLKMTKDPVPNIRFNVCKTLAVLLPTINHSVITSTVRPTLTQLLSDNDRDVRYFAAQTLAIGS